MIIKKGEYPAQINKEFKGGAGQFHIQHILTAEQLGTSGRLFALGTLESGHSAGWHVHEKDMEVCFCVSGSGTIIDNDKVEYSFNAGDSNIVPAGCGHEIINTGKEPLVYIVAVLYPNAEG